MKFFAYNDKTNDLNEFGSFTVVARKLNEQFNILNILGDPNDPECFVIYPQVFETQKIFKNQIPYLACEYSLSPQIVIDRLNAYNPFVLAISRFAENNIINSGYKNTDYVHLGTDENFAHYAADAGVKFPIVGALSGDVGARYRDAFASAQPFDSTRYHAMVSYAVSKSDSVGLRYSQAYGNAAEEKNAYRVTWTHSF
jgi:hypothetical protein